MRQILYLSQLPGLQAQLTDDFWRMLATRQLSAEITCFSQQEQLFGQLNHCEGEWLLVLLQTTLCPGELHALENRLSRLLLQTPQLRLTLLVYRWSFCITASEQVRRLVKLLHSSVNHRRIVPCDVEFAPEWSSLPPYRYRLLLCHGARCAQRGGARLWKQLSALLVQHDLLETPPGALLVKTYCQFPCNHGPVLTVYPGEYWYGIRQPADVQRLVELHIKTGKPVKELLLNFPGRCE